MRSAPYVAIVSPKILDVLGLLSPIKIGNHTTMLLGIPVIISRVLMSGGSERHESIHVWQMLECALVTLLVALGLALAPLGVWPAAILAFLSLFYGGPLFWAVYLGTYVGGFALGGLTGEQAYRNIPFEVEAYAHHGDSTYLASRKWFAWVRG